MTAVVIWRRWYARDDFDVYQCSCGHIFFVAPVPCPKTGIMVRCEWCGAETHSLDAEDRGVVGSVRRVLDNAFGRTKT